MIVDPTNHRVLEVLENRDKALVKAYLQRERDRGRLANVEEVTTDMWDAYVTAAKEVFGESVRITIDRFHVIKNLQEQLTNARRETQRDLSQEDRAALKGSGWLWLKNDESLSPEELKTLNELCQKFPRLGMLRVQRNRLREIFEDPGVRTAAYGRVCLWTRLFDAVVASGASVGPGRPGPFLQHARKLVGGDRELFRRPREQWPDRRL